MAGPMDDYLEVKERINTFYQRFPEGRIATEAIEFVTVGDAHGVLVTAQAWRTPDDPHPGRANGWCPIPGKNAFKRDSEPQNAETSAWGRALEAVGIPRRPGAPIVNGAVLDAIGDAPRVDTATAEKLNKAYRQLANVVGADATKLKVGEILGGFNVDRFEMLEPDQVGTVLDQIEAERLAAIEARSGATA